jgi:hypothetical protein
MENIYIILHLDIENVRSQLIKVGAAMCNMPGSPPNKRRVFCGLLTPPINFIKINKFYVLIQIQYGAFLVFKNEI